MDIGEIVGRINSALAANGGVLTWPQVMDLLSEDERRFVAPRFKAIEAEYGTFKRVLRFNPEAEVKVAFTVEAVS